MVGHARVLEKEQHGCRFWVTGRAGLPAFFHLGHRLSKLAAVSLLHQPWNGGAVDVMTLDRSADGAASPYFERKPWPVPVSEARDPVALVVSSVRRPSERQIDDAMAAQGKRKAGIVEAHASARLYATTVVPAMREIEQTLQATCDAYHARTTLAVFIAGPWSLAFLVGAAVNPRACRDVQIFQFEGDRYSLAYELPYPPVPERNRVLFFLSSPAGAVELALEQEIRALRLEQSAGTVADRLEIIDVPVAQARDTRNLLHQRQPGVLHFSGHGETGELLFQADDDSPRPMTTADLTELLRLMGGSVRLVVLIACHSESHAKALLDHVDCVVAMRGRILDADARCFTAAFYRHLAEGDSVQDTFDKALLAMTLERPAAARGGSTRDVVVPDRGPSDDGEPSTLHEQYPGLARSLQLVRRQR